MDNETLKAFGQFLQAVHSTQNPGNGHQVHPRLSAALGANETIPSEGGFTVPADFSSVLMKKIRKQTDIAQLCTSVPVTVGNSAKFPGVDETSRANGSRYGGIQSTWNQESNPITASKGKFWSAELILGKITAASYVTEELYSDAPLLGAFIELAFPLEAAFKLDEGILLGSGLGQPLGIMNSKALITVAPDDGQAAGSISPTNITGMFSRMMPGGRKNAVWFVSDTVESALYTLPAPAGAAALLFTPGDADAPFGRLMSRPIVPMEQAPAIGTTGDIVFADPSMYLLAQKPPELVLSVDVGFANGECVFRFFLRVDGQPAIRTPVTPYNGGSTQSAFVALETRA
jgi:HK97 family phage major capsid protein